MKVHLVDGTFELFRAYFSAPAARSADGLEVGATRGFARSMNALAQLPEVTHLAVAFDQRIESFRNELFEGYKTGAGIEPELMSQFPLAEDAVRALGIVCWPMVEFEADDAIATACARFAALDEVQEVVICSPDKDLAQCATSPKVVLWDRIRDKRLDANGVREKFGVEPASIPDYLALVGDKADGIPGVPKWGAKGASQALARYHRLEDIPRTAELWDIPLRGLSGLLESLASHSDVVQLYRRLATLRFDVPLTEALSDLLYRGAEADGIKQLCSRLDDDRLLSRVQLRDSNAST